MISQINDYGDAYIWRNVCTFRLRNDHDNDQLFKKQMDHTTFRVAQETISLVNSETRTSGIGDLQISSLLQIYNSDNFNLIMKSGLSLPIGSTNQKDNILTPQGNRPKVLLPYSMQNGSGTIDITQGIVGTKSYSHFSYGASWESTFRTQRNRWL